MAGASDGSADGLLLPILRANAKRWSVYPPHNASACIRTLTRLDRWPSRDAIDAAASSLSNRSLSFFGDSTLKNKAEFVRALSRALKEPNLRVEFTDIRKAGCPNISAVQPPPDVLVWGSTGLHHLHLRPSRWDKVQVLSPEAYRAKLFECAGRLNAALAGTRTRRVFRLANHICSSAYAGPYRRDADAWRERVDDALYPMTATEVGVRTLHAAEREMARALDWTLLHSHTDERLCSACTGRGDGRHYPWAVPNFAVRLAQQLGSSHAALPESHPENLF